MSNNYGITADNIMAVLPPVLQTDKVLHDIATVTAAELAQLYVDKKHGIVYARIDELDEDTLDILAYDFKVDWWNYGYTLTEKRKTLKESWFVRRHIGTKSAVQNAISAIYEGTTVREWSEYGGKPYHFRLLIPVDQTALDPTKHARVLALVNYYKNLRSVLDAVEYYGSGGAAVIGTAAAFAGSELVNSGYAANS